MAFVFYSGIKDETKDSFNISCVLQRKDWNILVN